ncbi:MAG: (d)CMP kinase [Spirochaetia bacterium]
MIVAIDGPAGTGKSILAKRISQELDFFLLNTGLFYRALTYQWIESKKGKNSSILDADQLLKIAQMTKYEASENGFFVNKVDILEHLRTATIDNFVSEISAFPAVREVLNEKMRTVAGGKNKIVCEGRDTTTVIFPDAKIKIYLDASIQVRALRRYNEKCSTLSLQEIEALIAKRDHNDKTKAVGALRISETACYIDSSDLTLDEVYEKLRTKVFDSLQ